jgi:hypothetical protein
MANVMMANVIVRLLVGLGLLTLGRQLFWLFVGAVGFILGINVATTFFSDQPEWVILLIALLAGVVGAVLALVLQQVAVIIAGFIAGGIIAVDLLRLLELQNDIALWIPFIVGGLIGAILVAALFDWALIILSSLSGAALIVETELFDLRTPLNFVVLVVLVTLGIVIQAASMKRSG